MSIFTECSQAAQEILADVSLTPRRHQGVFTDLDVVLRAAENTGGYQGDAFKLALIEANNLLGRLFREARVERFGPVKPPGIKPDYARIASRIAYAHPDGPKRLETPNGKFKRLSITQDEMHPGRRAGTNRDDLTLWSEQDYGPRKKGALAEAHAEIARLKALLTV